MAALAVVLLVMAGLLLFAVLRSILLQRRVIDLESRLTTLERSMHGLSVQQTSPAPPPAITLLESPSPSPPTAQPFGFPPEPTQPPAQPSRTREEWEAFVGGRLLNRIGAFAIIIGIGFFLKHAFDNNWISEPVRVLFGLLVGGGALVVARRTHARGFEIFAQGLVGAGIGILYLSVYASFNYYSLLPQIPSFVLMAGVTTLALVQAIQYRSLGVAILGWAGGYLTPWMLSTGEPNEVKLFVYLALLTVAMLGLVVRMPAWSVLQPLTLAGTWLWYFIWHADMYDTDVLSMTLFFVLVFWAAFVAADQVQLRTGAPFGWERRTSLIANSVLGGLALWLVVEPESDVIAGFVVLGMAAAYLLPFLRSIHDPGRPYSAVSTTVASALAVVGLGLVASEHGDVALWSGLAALTVYASLKRGLPHLVVVAQVIILLAAAHLATIVGSLVSETVRDFTPVIHERTLGFGGLFAGSFLAFVFLRGDADRRAARDLFLTVAGMALVVYCTVEVNDLLRVWRLDLEQDPMAFRWFLSVLMIGALWSLLGLAAFAVGLRNRLLALVWLGVVTLLLGAVVIAVRGVSVNVISFHVPLLNLRVVAMLATALAVAFAARLALQYRDLAPLLPSIHRVFAIGAIVVIFSLLSGETLDWFERSVDAVREEGADVLADLQDGQQLALSLVWLLYSVVLMVVGFWRSNRGLRLIAIGLFGITILKIFLYDLSSLETAYRIVSFVGLGAILLGVSYGYQRYKHLLM